MKKKWMCILLVGIMLLSLSACGGEKETAEESKGSEDEAVGEKKEESVVEVSIEQQILCDQDGIKIISNGLEETKSGYDLKLTVENNSDKKIAIMERELLVNDFTFEFPISEANEMYFSEFHAVMKGAGVLNEAEAGETMETAIDIHKRDLEAAKITSIGKIELALDVYDTESFEGILQTELIEIQTSEYGKVKGEVPSGTEFFNQSGIRIVGYGLIKDEENQEYVMNFYVENDSNDAISVGVVNANEIKEDAVSIGISGDERVEAGKKGAWKQNLPYNIEEEVYDLENAEVEVTITERRNIILNIEKVSSDGSSYIEKIGYSEAIPMSSLE